MYSITGSELKILTEMHKDKLIERFVEDIFRLCEYHAKRGIDTFVVSKDSFPSIHYWYWAVSKIFEDSFNTEQNFISMFTLKGINIEFGTVDNSSDIMDKIIIVSW